MEPESYENIVWVGGQYSPPTLARVRNLVDIGKLILQRTPNKTKSCICIVPQSGLGNAPPGISQDCIKNEHRYRINIAFLQAVIYEAGLAGLDFNKIRYVLSDSEITSSTQVTVKDSVEALLLKVGQAKNIFIAKPFGTILEIMRRYTPDSSFLINNYSFIIWPEMHDDILNISDNIRDALKLNSPGKQVAPPITNEKVINDIINNKVVVIQVNEPYASSEPGIVRKLIGKSGKINPQELTPYLHPIVSDTIRVLEIDVPKLYQHPKCREFYKKIKSLKRR